MRRATQIISLALMVILGIQSCAVSIGGSAVESLSTTEADQQQGEDLAGAGAFGVLTALLWLVGAAFVMSRPKVAMWLYGSAGLMCLIGAAAGFTDLWIWMVVSIGFGAMSWRGISEKARAEEAVRAAYRADVEAAAAAVIERQGEQS